jgi:tetratricopeptide (TPR) repeat protein
MSAEAIAHFRAALEVAPDDPVARANLCDALVADGRAAEAIALAERAIEGTQDWHRIAGAHNWLGWHLMNTPETLERALEHLRGALRQRPFWGVAHANLAKALELARRSDEAFEHLVAALASSDSFDRVFCHERIGAYYARHGWFRNAVREMRRALREDERGKGARRATYVEALAWLEQQLRAAGIEPPPIERADDPAWTRACELELPAGFGARDEYGKPLTDDVIEVERIARTERWADVAAYLEMLRGRDYGKLWDAVGFAEAAADRAYRTGHRADAVTILRIVEDAYRYYASGASSGGEGLARMDGVHRVVAKLAAWESAP